MNTALKTEVLLIEPKQANSIVSTLNTFLIDLGYSQDRIDHLECRRRDGFIPYSHNFGGLGAVAFSDQENMRNAGTGFKNADETIEKYFKYDIEYFETKDGFGIPSNKWTEKQWDEFYESRANNSNEETVLFSVDMMHTGIERGVHTLNIRMCVCVKDSPYHRKYDDLMEFDLRFKTIESLRRQLTKILRNKEVIKFSKCLNESF